MSWGTPIYKGLAFSPFYGREQQHLATQQRSATDLTETYCGPGELIVRRPIKGLTLDPLGFTLRKVSSSHSSRPAGYWSTFVRRFRRAWFVLWFERPPREFTYEDRQ